MKNLLFFLIISINGYCQFNSDSVIFKNNVKEVRIKNSDGKIISLTKYNRDGKKQFNSSDRDFIKTSESIIYNLDGSIHKTSKTHSSFPNDSTIWFYNYNNNKDLVKIIDSKGNVLFEYIYDINNRKTKEILFDNNIISQTSTYEYLNNDSKIIEYINGDFIKNRVNITYFDNNKNEIKSESLDDGKLRFSTSNIYNQNMIVKSIFIDENSTSGENLYYDDKKRLIKRELFELIDNKEILGQFEMYEYFSNDLISKYIENIYSMNNLGEVYNFEYEFYN